MLRSVASEVTDIDGRLVKLTDDMFETMYQAPGIGLAAPQIGVGKRLFVYDLDPENRSEPGVLVNPRIVESDGEWTYQEGCLSIPGLYYDIVRPKAVHIVGLDLDGNEVSLEADELLARLFQHELDHLDGILMIERMDPDTRKQAKRDIRSLQAALDAAPAASGLSLP